MADYYDFNKINELVPIEDVLSLHGIYPNSKGWYSIRSEDDTPSAHIDTQRRFGNTIRDFGVSNTFNPISLTMYLRNIDEKEAAQVLGEAFGIAPETRSKNNPDIVSDWEWGQVGIYPDMASKNMDFFPEKYGIAKTQEYADKFRMSMNELKNEDLKMYERIVCSRAIPHIINMRNEYYKTMYSEFSLHRMILESSSKSEGSSKQPFDYNVVLINNKEVFGSFADELSKTEAVLKKIIKDTSVSFKFQSYNPAVDFKNMVSGKIDFEIGNNSYFEVRQNAAKEKTKVFYCLVGIDEYHRLVDNGLDKIKVAAFQKGDKVNLAFSGKDSSKVEYLVRALRGKELDVGKTVAENLMSESKTPDRNIESPVGAIDNSSKASVPMSSFGGVPTHKDVAQVEEKATEQDLTTKTRNSTLGMN